MDLSSGRLTSALPGLVQGLGAGELPVENLCLLECEVNAEDALEQLFAQCPKLREVRLKGELVDSLSRKFALKFFPDVYVVADLRGNGETSKTALLAD